MFKFNFNRLKLFNKFNNNFNHKEMFSRFASEYNVVKQEELINFLEQDVCVIDVRTEYEFKGVHVKNAINIPVNVLSRDILNIIPDKNTKILVYCIVGERTKVAIQKLNSLGYRNIYIWGNGGLNSLKYKEILEY